MKRRHFAIAVPLLAIVMLSGCSSYYSPEVYDIMANEELPIDEYRPEEQPGWAPDESEMPGYFSEPSGWFCDYDVTYNYDWHDDVLCTRGVESQRPYLLAGFDFVTYEEILTAAADYEVYLNSQ